MRPFGKCPIHKVVLSGWYCELCNAELSGTGDADK
jgi:hypothetical protein